VIFYLKPEWRNSLHHDQFIVKQAKDLTSKFRLDGGDVLAVTQKVTFKPRQEHLQIPRTFDKVAGQFGILHGTRNTTVPVSYNKDARP